MIVNQAQRQWNENKYENETDTLTNQLGITQTITSFYINQEEFIQLFTNVINLHENTQKKTCTKILEHTTKLNLNKETLLVSSLF